MDELTGPIVAYVLLMAVVVVSVVMGNVAEELGVTQAEFLLVVFLFTIVPGLFLLYLRRTA